MVGDVVVSARVICTSVEGSGVAGVGDEKASVLGAGVVGDRVVGARDVGASVEGAGVAVVSVEETTCYGMVW